MNKLAVAGAASLAALLLTAVAAAACGRGSGNLVLGWFTRQGDRVGLTDFFLFADHFGLSEGEDDYDSRFDIVANGIVDLLDFSVLRTTLEHWSQTPRKFRTYLDCNNQ